VVTVLDAQWGLNPEVSKYHEATRTELELDKESVRF
jgi:hypothetical protein